MLEKTVAQIRLFQQTYQTSHWWRWCCPTLPKARDA